MHCICRCYGRIGYFGAFLGLGEVCGGVVVWRRLLDGVMDGGVGGWARLERGCMFDLHVRTRGVGLIVVVFVVVWRHLS